jgi:hypothetical protein
VNESIGGVQQYFTNSSTMNNTNNTIPWPITTSEYNTIDNNSYYQSAPPQPPTSQQHQEQYVS